MTYLVEFRPKTGWDAGGVADAVVIHDARWRRRADRVVRE